MRREARGKGSRREAKCPLQTTLSKMQFISQSARRFSEHFSNEMQGDVKIDNLNFQLGVTLNLSQTSVVTEGLKGRAVGELASLYALHFGKCIYLLL